MKRFHCNTCHGDQYSSAALADQLHRNCIWCGKASVVEVPVDYKCPEVRIRQDFDKDAEKLMYPEVQSMTMSDIREVIWQLAQSQGFYGSLHGRLTDLEEDSPVLYRLLANELEAKHFKDAVDLILYLEGA